MRAGARSTVLRHGALHDQQRGQYGQQHARPSQQRERHGRPARRGERQRARASWPQWCRDTIFVSWKGAAFCVATRRSSERHGAAIRCLARYTALRHGTVRAATRLCVRCNMALCARSLDLGCTDCAQPSFDTVYYFESLFRPLFMDTVHEHCSRGTKKIKFLFVDDLIYGMFVLHYL